MSRYALHKTIDGCLSPITVFHYGKKYSVPCGKCAACIVNRSNKWNWRLSDEIEAFDYSIFVTFTYNNKYVPKLHLNYLDGLYWLERDDYDIRFDGKKNVLRDDDFSDIPYIQSRSFPTINRFFSKDYFAYSSKRDFQLYLKILRRYLDDYVSNGYLTYEDSKIRYYAISEYGPITYRPHIHVIFFVRSQKCAELLIESALYHCWQMSDKDLFQNYISYADNRASGYLSSYLTSFASLPKILQNKCFRPFRLSSKSPSVGFSSYDRKKIQEDVFAGTIEYSKSIPRIDASYVFRYSSVYLSSIFPRCYQYSLQSYFGLYRLYGSLYTEVVEKGRKFVVVSQRLRKNLRPIDYICTRRCYEFCVDNNTSPHVYLFLLDNVLYCSAMFALKQFYTWQETAFPVDILFSYTNISDYRSNYYRLDDYSRYVFILFLQGFSVDVLDFLTGSYYDLYQTSSAKRSLYSAELNDIMVEMVKTKKINEILGVSPTQNY